MSTQIKGTLNRMLAEHNNMLSQCDAIAIASHGRKGGEFVTKKWANGQLMVEPVNSGHICPPAISATAFEKIKAAGWVIHS